MDMIYFNVDHGYADSLVRQLRIGFLTEAVYTNLKSCNNLSDFKMVLEETDYKGVVSQTPDIEITDLKTKLRQKLAQEFEHLIAQSVQPLTGFLKMILHGFMIDNVVNVIEGVKNNVDIEILLKRADPLGDFPELKNIRMVDEDYDSLYETVLIDLPIGKYF